MILQKIGKLSKGVRSIVIVNRHDGTQWLGTPIGIYPVYGINLTEEAVFTLFDIGDERESFDVKELFEDELSDFGLSIHDTVEDEIPLLYRGMNILSSNKELMPLEYDNGILLIDSDYLAPLKGVPELRCFARQKNADSATVVIKSGFQIVALIAPQKLPDVCAAILRKVSTLANVAHGRDGFKLGTLFETDDERFERGDSDEND